MESTESSDMQNNAYSNAVLQHSMLRIVWIVKMTENGN